LDDLDADNQDADYHTKTLDWAMPIDWLCYYSHHRLLRKAFSRAKNQLRVLSGRVLIEMVYVMEIDDNHVNTDERQIDYPRRIFCVCCHGCQGYDYCYVELGVTVVLLVVEVCIPWLKGSDDDIVVFGDINFRCQAADMDLI
jgi:hypothetical protein